MTYLKRLIVILSMVFVLMGCQKPTELSIIVPTGNPEMASIFLQSNKDYDVDVVLGADPLIAAFASASHDAIIAPTNLGAIMYHDSQSYQLAATLIWGNFYVVTRNTSISDINDLDAEEILIFGQNQTPELIISLIMNHENIDVSYRYADSVSMVASLFSYDPYQVALLSEPYVTMMRQSFPDLTIFDLQDRYQEMTGKSDYPQASLFIKQSLSDDLKQTIMDDLALSVVSIKDDVDQAADLMIEKGVSLDKAVLIEVLSKDYIRYEQTSDIRSDILYYFDLILTEMPHLLGGMIPDASFFYEDLT